jgi:hypothetical protein
MKTGPSALGFAVSLVVPAFASDGASTVAAGPVTTRHLRDRLREIRIKAIYEEYVV